MNVKPILLLSVVANLALVSVLAWSLSRKAAPPTPMPSAPLTAGAATELTKPAGHAPASTEPAGVTPAASTHQFDWRMVESEDYRKYIANLRAIGCPEETIRDIIVADVNKLYENRRKELGGAKKKFEYWKAGGMMGMTVDPERLEKERALNREKRALLTELLGSAPEETPDLLAGAATQLEAMFDFLPAEKRGKVFEVMQDMQTRMQESMKKGAPDAEDMNKLMKETEAAIAAVLTPEEMLDYNLRFSMTANMMRTQMGGFEPSEAEFLDIFKLRKGYDDEYGMNPAGLPKTEKEKADAAKKELETRIKSLLGDERYTDYERSQDWTFQSMYRVAERNGLGKTEAVKVYDMKKLAEEEARKLRLDTSLTPEQRTTALRNIRAETEKGMRTVFGEKGYAAYENQAWWLNTISPELKPPASKQ